MLRFYGTLLFKSCPSGNRKWGMPKLVQAHNVLCNSFLIMRTQNVEVRVLPDISVVIYLTKREAFVCFRFIEGRMDYAGFVGKDPAFPN